ncbi:MYND finger protein [Rhizoctonia solani 123E]|uniref:MYND finger protein n=1 Tax=Rhizoctonia solani 123E TaxID=1423351 RepID=A0A074RQ75_9AGAM|nr:MYND finger protein [Rhizoctonia solani 123E]
MSHPLYWLAKQFFYPIGNTAATSLTHDISSEQSADILLLGCGDPRNILFTLYSDLTIGNAPRKMDITCCDIDPAILARNILMFSLLEDNEETTECIWDLFYHFKIDDHTANVVERQSRKLFNFAKDIQSWCQSEYGLFLKMVDTRTLAELRRHWGYYADYSSLPRDRKERLLKEQTELSRSITGKGNLVITPSRSAGMVWPKALFPVSELFRKYWETGTTFTEASDINRATSLNPTFLYYLSGEGFNLHYGSFPQGFHLMPAFTPIANDPVGSLPDTGSAAINKSRQQFKAWCASFRSSREANVITIRFYCGDALAFCHALNTFKSTGNPSTNLFAAPYKAAQINLDELAASTPSAPLTFDVIDTSNLIDHVSLLNLLIATPSLLKQTPSSQSVLYTEALLPSGEDATKSFLDRLCTDVPTIAGLFGIAPRPYLCGFTPQSNVHEIVFSKSMKTEFSKLGAEMQGNQYHERVIWARPNSGDTLTSGKHITLSFEAESMTRILYGIYDKMFHNEKMTTLASSTTVSKLMSLAEVNFHRESVAYLFQAVRGRVHLRDGTWEQVANRFMQMGMEAGSRVMESNNYQDLCLQLHLIGIPTLDTLQPGWTTNLRLNPRSNLLDDWKTLPPVVCVVLTIPRRRLEVFNGDVKNIGTPTMQCCLRIEGSYENYFATIHAVWGRCVKSSDSDRIAIEEDPRGMAGSCDLVVSFWAITRLLERPGTQVDLRLKTTPAAMMAFRQKLGLDLHVFSANITDKHHVRVLPYRPTLASEPLQYPPSGQGLPVPTDRPDTLCEAIVTDKTGCYLDSLSIRFNVDVPQERESLLNGAGVSARQVSPCTMELKIGKHSHSIEYPYPIQGSNTKLRVARKSHYIEVMSKPSDNAGYFLNQFPIVGTGVAYRPWNIHHLNLDRLPMLDIKDPSKVEWLNPLGALQLSDAEKVVRNGNEARKEQAPHALLNLKDSIHAIAMHCSGVQDAKIEP